ncbi:MAG TPA: 50S ribosomal protein L25 [Acidimicrobiia bacterium]
MEQVTLRATRRGEAGTRPARRLRRDGFVPAIVYGRGIEPLPVVIDGHDLFMVLHTEAGANAVIKVEVEGGESVLTVAREVQRHPVRGEITHLDLIKVSLDVAIEAEVHLVFQGTPDPVKNEGAFVETIASSVLIEALPTQVPSSVEVDISALMIGDTLKVADLPTLDGVTYLDDLDKPLLTVLLPRAEEPEVEEVEEGEGAAIEAGAETAAEAASGASGDEG